jgi:hypothetical protein
MKMDFWNFLMLHDEAGLLLLDGRAAALTTLERTGWSELHIDEIGFASFWTF